MVDNVVLRAVEARVRELNGGVPVRLGLLARNNNSVLSDGKRFVVKVSTVADPVMLERELGFVKRFWGVVSSFKLLSDSLESVECARGGGVAAFYSVWGFESGVREFDPCGDIVGLARVYGEACRQLSVLHALPVSEFHMWGAEGLRRKVDARLGFMDSHACPHVTPGLLTRLLRLRDVLVTDEVMGFTGGVLCHSDAHLGNFVGCDRLPAGLWTDFESVSVAPRELDDAPTALYYKYFLQDEARWRVFRDAWEREVGELDEDILHRIELVKAFSGATYLIQNETKPGLLEARVEAVEEAISGMRLRRYAY